MPKRRLILGILALGLVAALVLAFTRPREPSYQDRSLSSWLEDIDSSWAEPREKAVEAVTHIGTNELQYLIESIRYEPPPWREQVIDLKFRRSRLLSGLIPADWREFQAIRAMKTLQFLGPKAKKAIPELDHLMIDPRRESSATRAALVLPFLGVDAIPPLKLSLTNQNARPSVRAAAVGQIYVLGTNAIELVPALLSSLSDTNRYLRSATSNALRKIAPQALTNAPAT